MSPQMLRRPLVSSLLFLSVTLAVCIGCQKKPTATTNDNSPVIPVSLTVEREVTDYADYTGRTDAVLAVNVRARATGYLLHTYFEEGADVKEGQLLFEIDPAPYLIQVKSAEATVDSSKATVKSAQAQVESDEIGRAKGGNVVSDLTYTTDLATLEGAKARLDGAYASLENAKLNLSYTKVFAQIDGQISRYYYTPGNLITQDSTLLTTIVSNDYMYAYFDIEERIFEKVIEEISRTKSISPIAVDALSMRAVAGGMSALTPLQLANFPVLMAIEGQANLRGEITQVRGDQIVLNIGTDTGVSIGNVLDVKRVADGGRLLGNAKVIEVQAKQATAVFTAARPNASLAQLLPEELPKKGDIVEASGFRYRGKLDFINNQVNPSTGTVAVRGYFKNNRKPGGLVSLIPGMFVRIRLPLGNQHKSQLIIDRAISSDQGLKFVYVLDAENKVQYRRVVTGALQEDGLRVIEPYKPKSGDEIESGIKADEWLVVGGLQQLKPRLKIEPEKIPMPTLASDAARLKSLGGGKDGGGKAKGEKGDKGEKGAKGEKK
jgi:multidrug efflux pump subunit AcrA (membrane-fusion protein)